jgi:hypothetical protein
MSRIFFAQVIGEEEAICTSLQTDNIFKDTEIIITLSDMDVFEIEN